MGIYRFNLESGEELTFGRNKEFTGEIKGLCVGQKF